MERLVDQTVDGAEQEDPEDGRGDPGDHHGQIEDRPEDPDPADPLAIEEQRDPEGHHDRQRDADHRQIERVGERLPEERVVDQGAVVVETDPARLLQDLEVREAVVERGDRRIEVERQEPDQPGRDEQEPGSEVPSFDPGQPQALPPAGPRRASSARAWRLGQGRHGRG